MSYLPRVIPAVFWIMLYLLCFIFSTINEGGPELPCMTGVTIILLFSLLLLLLLLLVLVWNSCTLISTNRYVLFLRYGISKTPHPSITFRKNLLVCIKIVICNSVIFVSIPMVFNPFSRVLAGVPRVPTNNKTTLTFIFHIFFSSQAGS